jgi:Xaa-Pro aminopeptidase
MMGHSVGIEVEQPWIMEGVEDRLVPNMVIAIEAAVGRPETGTAAFEQVMIVHEDGPEVLTEGCRKRWWS